MGIGDSEDARDEEGDTSPTLRDLAEKVKQREDEKRRNDSSMHSEDRRSAEIASSDSNVEGPNLPNEEFGTDPRTEAIIEVLGDPQNLLLLGPLLSPTDYDLCMRITETLPDDTEQLLLVTMSESPDQRVHTLRGYLDTFPAETVVLNVGDSSRSGSRETIATDGEGSVTIQNIPDPSDLMRIGITVSKQLSQWADSPGDTVVCVHSLTSLLQFAQTSQLVFRFIHVLRGRIQSSGAYGHYHMDRAAHEDEVIATFRPLFDEVLTFEEDGTVQVEHT